MPAVEPEKPASTWRLGEVGRYRAHLLTGKLKCLGPGVIWSSSEPKAVETAEIVAASFGVPVQIADGLEEHHRTGVPYFPTEEEFEAAVEQFFNAQDRLVLGTETAEQALGRFSAAIDDVLKREQTDNIVVTHGTVMTLYVSSVACVDRVCFWRRLEAPSFVVLSLPDMRIESVVDGVNSEGV